MAIDMASKDDFRQLVLVLQRGRAFQMHMDDYLGLSVILLASIVYLSHGYLWDRPDPYHHLWFEKPQSRSISKTQCVPEQQTRNIAAKLKESVRRGLVVLLCSSDRRVLEYRLTDASVLLEKGCSDLLGLAVGHRRKSRGSSVQGTQSAIRPGEPGGRPVRL